MTAFPGPRMRFVGGVGLVGAAVVSFACLAGRAGAADFLRGDANGDRVVSMADAHAVLSWLFRAGPGLECERSADVDDSGQVEISDGTKLLSFLFLGRQPPATPYPEAGPDTTEDELSCDSWGNGAPIEDPAAALAILSGSAPGGANPVAKIVLGLSSSVTTAGYSGTIVLPAGLAREVRKANLDLSGRLLDGFLDATLAGDRIRFSYLSALVRKRPLPRGEDQPVLEIALCLEDGVAAGDYPVALESAELVDFESGRSIAPALVGGTLTVAAAVSAGSTCALPPAPPPPKPVIEPLPPPPSGPPEVTYRLSDAIASPGQTVAVAFSIESNLAVQGYEFSVDFDEEVLQALDVETVWSKPDFADPSYDYEAYHVDNADLAPGSGGVDEGYLTGAVLFDMIVPVGMPIGVKVEALRFRFLVRPDAPTGDTAVSFVAGGINSWGRPVPNAITGGGTTVEAASVDSFVLVGSILRVQPDIAIFIRGDANDNEALEIGDPVTTLGRLFLGTDDPPCEDSLDSNDDGAVEITDAIYTLSYLFLGGAQPPAPFPLAGGDLTDDDPLGCERGS